MAIIKSIVSIFFVFVASADMLIPECYLAFRGNSTYFYRESSRKFPGSNFSTEFKISPKKTVRNYILDSYTAKFVTSDSTRIVEINIQLCDTKKFKQRVLARYNLIDQGNIRCNCSNKQGFTEFQVDSTTIYGFTAADIKKADLGDYVFFPSDNMAVFIRFSARSMQAFANIESYIEARKDFIHSYLSNNAGCKSR